MKNNIICENLNKYINEQKLTQVELASIMNVSQAAVHKWLNDGSISIEKIPQLCKALNITPNDLFGFKEKEEIIQKYKEHPELHSAINKLLEIK